MIASSFYNDNLRGLPLIAPLLAVAQIRIPSSRRILNPLDPSDTNPSCVVYDDHLYDWGSGDAISPYRLCREIFNLEHRQTIDYLCQLVGLDSPYQTGVKVRPMSRPVQNLTPAPAVDARAFEGFAQACFEALAVPRTRTAEHASEYLESRGILFASLVARVGVWDSSVREKAPYGGLTGGMLIFPYWNNNGALITLKGRTPVTDKNHRRMWNLKGAPMSVPYGLESLNIGRDVWAVEGETDRLSVLEAFGGDGNVFGAPSKNAMRVFGHPSLRAERLFIAPDPEPDAIERARQAARSLRDLGRQVWILEGFEADKNDLLKVHGAAGLREIMLQAQCLSLERNSRAASRSLLGGMR